MFGTLVICLPSKHEGGGVVARHKGETVAFETSEASEFGQSHMAWYVIPLQLLTPVLIHS